MRFIRDLPLNVRANLPERQDNTSRTQVNCLAASAAHSMQNPIGPCATDGRAV